MIANPSEFKELKAIHNCEEEAEDEEVIANPSEFKELKAIHNPETVTSGTVDIANPSEFKESRKLTFPSSNIKISHVFVDSRKPSLFLLIITKNHSI